MLIPTGSPQEFLGGKSGCGLQSSHVVVVVVVVVVLVLVLVLLLVEEEVVVSSGGRRRWGAGGRPTSVLIARARSVLPEPGGP